ncbi:MFS transporter [Halalkalibacillus sediminis]|uniref:MFS transporter n=1 Tax=Halalkalibacillus sediminis TaxID=2018042 RepID=A0A2I0QSF8_9BACI|nr:MFS transporter [Halalkalibacillus sediminis]PKR77249.1 MFS transporter [Halalkalibacillus sediminis]
MPKRVWLLIIGMAINVTGASFIWPLNTIYMHHELGKSLAFAGMILLFNQGAAIIGNLVGGTLFDRIGGYRTVLTGGVITLLSALTLTQFHTLLPYSILLVTMGLGSGIIFPAMYAMAASIWPDGGRRPFNAIYVAQNLGVALGASIGGFIAFYSFSYIFIANAILFSSFFLLVLVKFKPMDQRQDSKAYSTVLSQGVAIKDKRAFSSLMILSVGFFICWIAYVQWQTTIAAYTQDLGITIDKYSLIWTINGVLIILGQPLVKFVTKYVTSPKSQILLGNTIFICSFIYLLQAETFADFALGMVILTLGEIFVWPAVPTIAAGLAPKGRTGFYQGIINSVGTGGRMLGPTFGGLMADNLPIQVLFMTLIFLLLIPYVSTWLLTRVEPEPQKGA